jgi:hypothetical protein
MFGRLFDVRHASHGTLLASLRRTDVHSSWLNEIAVTASHIEVVHAFAVSGDQTAQSDRNAYPATLNRVGPGRFGKRLRHVIA